MKFKVLCSVLPVVFLAACGGGQNEPQAPTDATVQSADGGGKTDAMEASSSEDEGPASGPWDIPSECHKGSDPCTPNPKWVKKLCEDVYPAVALYLFSKSSPFTHGYLSRKTRAVNASGGATSGDEWLSFDEEVVLLYHRQEDMGGMQVSGSGGGYDAMRLDGSCVTLGAEEVRLERPPTPKYAKVPWRYIGDDMQDALRQNDEIKEAYMERRKECKGAFSGSVSKACVTKDEKLNRVIIDALAAGTVEIPQPQARP